MTALFTKAKIRATIKKGLAQVPSYLWEIKPNQVSEVVDLVCRATHELWNSHSLKNETIARKAIFSLHFYGASIKQMNAGPYLPFLVAAEAIASANDDIMFNGLVGAMFEKDPPTAPPV